MTNASGAKRVDSASRIIKASPRAVYDAFIDPDALVAWLPSAGTTGRIHVFEPRAGGAFRMTLVFENAHGAGKTSDDTDEVTGRFVRLVPAELIVQEIEFVSDDPVFAGTMTMTWKLTPAAGGTEVTITGENVPSGISPEDQQRAWLRPSPTWPPGSSEPGWNLPPAARPRRKSGSDDMIRIKLTSVMVDDQAKALDFYTRVLGFRMKHDLPLGEHRWLTVIDADEPEGTELLLEPNTAIAEAAVFQKALYDAGIPIILVAADDLNAEYRRLKALGVSLRGAPTRPESGPATLLVEDGCGNLVRLFQP